MCHEMRGGIMHLLLTSFSVSVLSSIVFFFPILKTEDVSYPLFRSENVRTSRRRIERRSSWEGKGNDDEGHAWEDILRRSIFPSFLLRSLQEIHIKLGYTRMDRHWGHVKGPSLFLAFPSLICSLLVVVSPDETGSLIPKRIECNLFHFVIPVLQFFKHETFCFPFSISEKSFSNGSYMSSSQVIRRSLVMFDAFKSSRRRCDVIDMRVPSSWSTCIGFRFRWLSSRGDERRTRRRLDLLNPSPEFQCDV